MRNPLDRMKIRPCQFGALDPLSNTFGLVRVHNTRPHQGWDLEATVGTPVYAVADGGIKAGVSSTYGNWLSLKLSHKGRTYFAFYAHLSNYLTQVQNQFVAEGTPIAQTGMSGNARTIPLPEAHLHFEVRIVEFPAGGLSGRVDPGEILGYRFYSSHV
jgi:murein DD-endopeptidase MepM/ murein hydrolase activator NlpD